MEEEEVRINFELPVEIEADERKELAQNLKEAGFEVELVDSKTGVIEVILLSIAIVKGGMEAAKAIQGAAKILHGFLHPEDKGKNKVVLFDEYGKKAELSGLSEKELEKLIDHIYTAKTGE
jgi:predicted mannosyl-3-phosphoglycerate phosphatase (HAD superfamily)